jgi:ABC-2 type transport system permease protein
MNFAPAFSPPRVAANLSHAFGGVWRLTLRRYLLPARWLTVVIGLGVLALLCLGSSHRSAAPYLGWACGFYVTFVVPAFAFMSAAGALRDEMKAGTVDYVLTRPLPRPAFVVFKYLAHLAGVQIDLLLAFAVVLGVGYGRGAEGLTAAVAPMLLAQVMLVAGFTAFGFLCGGLTKGYVLIGLGYAAIVEAGIGQIPTQLSRLSMTHQVRGLLAPLMDPAAALVPVSAWFSTGAMLLAFGVLTLAAAAAVFTLRELAGPTEA